MPKLAFDSFVAGQQAYSGAVKAAGKQIVDGAFEAGLIVKQANRFPDLGRHSGPPHDQVTERALSRNPDGATCRSHRLPNERMRSRS
jgi:hypothetical protein